jgi:RNA polymerase sigma-70 factor (ECF subfamily)
MVSQSYKDFSELYINYYLRLVHFAADYVISEEDAENIVQDVFLQLWENRASLNHVENMNAYLFRLIKNKCLDHLRHEILVEKYNSEMKSSYDKELFLKMQSLSQFEDNIFDDNKLSKIVNTAIASLPTKCRQIFILNRVDGLKYKDISEKLSISENTVENQMSIALKKLREKLEKYRSLLLIILILAFLG